jgi:N-glycosylase/DNA lyase
MSESGFLEPQTPLNLDATLASAQTFQWVKKHGGWLGPVNGGVAYLAQGDGGVLFKLYGLHDWSPERYFRLDDDYQKILDALSFDPLVRQLIGQQPGLRLTRQDPWECLLMFVCSTNNNYRRIVGMVLSLNRRFGLRVHTDFGWVNVFPTPKALSEASLGELVGCGLGYRSKYILNLAKKLVEDKIDLYGLIGKDHSEIRETLLELPGVGPKVADCVSLFSLERLDSFPIDTWIRRILAEFYSGLFDHGTVGSLSHGSKISVGVYNRVSRTMRQYFGQYCGYAQNQLYYHAKWLLKKRVCSEAKH